MSADNWVGIVEVDGHFKGYELSASMDTPTIAELAKHTPIFVVDTLREAIYAAQEHDTEYAYHFLNIESISKQIEGSTSLVDIECRNKDRIARAKAQKDILEYLGRTEEDVSWILLSNLVDDVVRREWTAKGIVDYYWECDQMRWRVRVDTPYAWFEWVDGYVDGARLDYYYADEDY